MDLTDSIEFFSKQDLLSVIIAVYRDKTGGEPLKFLECYRRYDISRVQYQLDPRCVEQRDALRYKRHLVPI